MKQRLGLPMFLVLATVMVCLASEPAGSDAANADWKLSADNHGVAIYSRPHSGSSLKEFKAIGDIDAPSRAVHEVIDDIGAYSNFMPYITECRLVKRENDSLITYQRFSPKICCDRDYTLRIQEVSWPAATGLVYSNRWEPANELGPPKKTGVVRINICRGAWLLEPDGGDKTRATYSLYTETGGLIPAFVANHFSQTAIEKVFAAVRKQVKEPKYNPSDR
jgi:hypothetical protein